MIYDDVTELIGDTPLLRLDPCVHGLPDVDLYAKLESQNPFGSVKDRVAWGMLVDHLDDVTRAGETLVEASSGNTAKALRAIAATHGVPVRAVTNRVKVAEVRDLLLFLGVELEELPGLSECPDPTAPRDAFTVIEEIIASDPPAYRHLSQYTNERNVDAHYRGTGREIHDDLGRVDHLFGGLGTTGSTRGAASYLRERNPELRTYGIVSSRADFIPGIRSESEMWEVGLFRPDFYDEIVTVDSTAAVEATALLARRYGVLAGPTSGATYAVAVDRLRRAPPPDDGGRLVAVFLVCDRLEPYLSYLKKRRPDLFGGAAPVVVDAPVAPELSPAELTAIEEERQVLKVDTRGNMAYRIGHVPGSVNITDDYLDDMLRHGLPFPRSLPVVFCCPTGEDSKRFAARARLAGCEAYSLAGGVLAWRDEGLPLEPVSGQR